MAFSQHTPTFARSLCRFQMQFSGVAEVQQFFGRYAADAASRATSGPLVIAAYVDEEVSSWEG